jgi:hypothetical protein
VDKKVDTPTVEVALTCTAVCHALALPDSHVGGASFNAWSRLRV